MDAFISRSWGRAWCAQPLSDQPVGDRYIRPVRLGGDFVCQCGRQHDDGDDGGLAGGLLSMLSDPVRGFVMIGFLGALTTFSALPWMRTAFPAW